MTEYDFDSLTEPQQRHLCFAATSNHYQGHPGVMKRLEALGMVVQEKTVLPGRFPVRIKSWSVPLPVHIQWCEWCAKRYPDDG